MSVHTQCAWAWYWLSGHTYTIYIYTYGDKHTSTRKEIEISPPNVSEGGSLRLPTEAMWQLEIKYRINQNISEQYSKLMAG